MLVLPKELTHSQATACLRMLVQGLCSQSGPDVVVDATGLIRFGCAGLFGMNQDVFAQRIEADGNGNLSFSFSPQFPLPSTRYEVSMTASKYGMTLTESRLVLFQK